MVTEKRTKRPTSIDVARLAGVSQSTVSNVINNHTHVAISEETRERVLRAIAQLDYQPHEAARNLRSRSSHIIGMTIPEMRNPHYIETAAGATQYAKDAKYSIFLAATNFALELEEQCMNWLKQQRYDALILTSASRSVLYDKLHAAFRQGYPVTTVGFRDPLLDSVTFTEMEGERLVMAHLHELGHQRIGYIYGVIDHTFLEGRLEHCLTLQRAFGLPVDTALIRRCGPELEDGYRSTLELLQTVPRHAWPTALVVVNDLLAIGVLAALSDHGLSVPHDMSVISFDNVAQATRTIPALTTVDCDAYAMGTEAARLTIERLRDPARPPEHVQTRVRLVTRASTGKLPDAS